MSEHEDLADRRDREAEELEQDTEQLESSIEDAKDAAERAASDPWIPSPAKEPAEGGPEADYPTKD